MEVDNLSRCSEELLELSSFDENRDFDYVDMPVRRRKGTNPSFSEKAEVWSLYILRWRLKIMGVDSSAKWWSRIPGCILFLFTICAFADRIALLVYRNHESSADAREGMVIALAALGSVCAWGFCWGALRHVELTLVELTAGIISSDKVRTRIQIIEIIMFVASVTLFATLIAAHSEAPWTVPLYFGVAVVVALPYHVFVELLQIQCAVYEDIITEHVAQIKADNGKPLSQVTAVIKQGEGHFIVGVVFNCMVCIVQLILVAILISESGLLSVVGYLGVSVFYTIVLTAQLVPIAMLNFLAENAVKAPLCALDEVLHQTVQHEPSDTEEDLLGGGVDPPSVGRKTTKDINDHSNDDIEMTLARVVSLTALLSAPPVLDILGLTITPIVLIRALSSITIGNIAAVAYTYLRSTI